MANITPLQHNIMMFVKDWIRRENIPVPQKEIMISMMAKDVHERTAYFAIASLVRKGYIRKSCGEQKRAVYIMCRNI